LINFLKPILFRYNRVYPVLRGPLKGFKIRLTKNLQYAPIIGNWEPVSAYIFTQIIKSGNIVFDLGAQAGTHTLLFAKLTGTNGYVYAFEPFLHNIEDLEFNVRLNNLINVNIIKKAVSNFNGRSTFLLGKHSKQGSLKITGNETGEIVEVDVITLDDFIISLKNIYPDFIKIDIEGSEKDALHGYYKTVRNSFPTFYIESHNIENEVAISQFISKFGYKSYVVDSSYKKFENDLNLPYLVNIKSTNILFDETAGGRGSVLCVHPSRFTQLKLNKI
jgi:FkbM family methyltransferase